MGNDLANRWGLDRACYSVSDTLRLLSTSRTTFYKLVKQGDLPLAKLGKKSLVYACDIAAFLEKLKRAA